MGLFVCICWGVSPPTSLLVVPGDEVSGVISGWFQQIACESIPLPPSNVSPSPALAYRTNYLLYSVFRLLVRLAVHISQRSLSLSMCLIVYCLRRMVLLSTSGSWCVAVAFWPERCCYQMYRNCI